MRNYSFVCRWAGGNNAGHTIYIDSKKYKTHLIPSGVFYGITSAIGPGCVVNINSFFKDILRAFENIKIMKTYMEYLLFSRCALLQTIIFCLIK